MICKVQACGCAHARVKQLHADTNCNKFHITHRQTDTDIHVLVQIHTVTVTHTHKLVCVRVEGCLPQCRFWRAIFKSAIEIRDLPHFMFYICLSSKIKYEDHLIFTYPAYVWGRMARFCARCLACMLKTGWDCCSWQQWHVSWIVWCGMVGCTCLWMWMLM